MSEQTQPEGSQRGEREIGAAMGALFPTPAPQPVEEEELAEDSDEPTEASTEEEASEEEPADPEDEEPSDQPFMTVVVDGVERAIATEEEAISFARQGMHYTQEMQKLRETEREHAAQHQTTIAQLRQKETEYAAALSTLSDTFGAVLGAEPDWSALYAENPEQYAHTRAQWDQLAAIRAEQQRIVGEQQQQSQRQMQQWAQQQADALRGHKPEWTDPATKQKDLGLMRDYALSIGSTDEELRQIMDHRFWIMLHDAARYRQAQSTGKQRIVKAKTKTAEPGSGTKTTSQAMNKLRQRVAETGDEQAASQLLQHMLTSKKAS